MALNNFETYISVEDAKEYAALMGLELPSDEETLEPLLRRAAIYLDRLYGSRYAGAKMDIGQFLEWPRDVYFGVGAGLYVPKQLGYAQVELAAVLQANDNALPVPEARLKKQSVKIEGLEETLEFADVNGYAIDPFDRVLMALGTWLNIGTGSKGFSRKLTMTRGA